MDNVKGILLIVASMAAFSLEDMFIKRLLDSVSTGQIMVVLGVVCGLLLTALSIATRKRIFDPMAWQVLPLARAASEGLGAIAFVTALAVVELSTVAAVFQATPLAVTMGAALFLGEQVGWRRWCAIGVGFIGVMIIIRPGLAGFQPEALFVVASVVAIAARDLITRKLDSRVATSVVALQAYVAVGVIGVILATFSAQPFTPIQSDQIGFYIGAIGFGVLGYCGIVVAMRTGEASALTPFRNTRLVFSIAAGMLMFGERPDFLTLTGAVLIIGSGMYTYFRERKLAQAFLVSG
ncbi:DMT family transporter [Ruegeria arenilitoris]|uniref:DMT family transporter n=1 Tax=Ruegeria arenilitoris TaxID=1173585 RepID=UPI00147C02B5|nr:DMT family transporter [Ruegeria arenilitoris]